MEHFFNAVLKRGKLVLILFFASAAVCALLGGFVSVNYNFKDYLPADSPSTVAVNVMGKEYTGGVPNASVMVKNVTIPQALLIKNAIAGVEGVTAVTWLDDAADITQPFDTLGKSVTDAYYKDNCALFQVTVNNTSILQAVGGIREAAERFSGEVYMSGSAVTTATATDTVSTEVMKIVLFAVPLTFIILIFTTTSWFEPVLFMVTIGIAVLLNRGTNIIFGEISFVTNAAAGILQLAVSMDYSIFLLHRFADFRAGGMDVSEAMRCALKKSFAPVLSSGLTTVIGFAALILMKFRIGPDMGWVMAKAIFFSLISVLIFLPVLAVTFCGLIDKTRHRPFIPKFGGFAKAVFRCRIPFLLIFALIIVPCFLAQRKNDFWYGGSHIFGEGTYAYEQAAETEKVFESVNSMVLLVPKGDTAKQKEFSSELKKAVPEIASVISYTDTVGAEIPPEYLDGETLSKLVSADYSRMVLTVRCEPEGEKAFATVRNIRGVADGYYGDSYLFTGDTVVSYDMMNVVTEDIVKVNAIAVIAIFLILLLTLRTPLLPVLLVLVIESSIWLNLAIPYFSGSPVFYIAYLIITSIQLGATVDYAILMASRYREERRTKDKKTAVTETLTHTSVSILTSGTILTIGGLTLGVISTNGIISQLGLFVGRAGILSAVTVLAVLPALLYYCDRLFISKRCSTEEAKNDEDRK